MTFAELECFAAAVDILLLSVDEGLNVLTKLLSNLAVIKFSREGGNSVINTP